MFLTLNYRCTYVPFFLTGDGPAAVAYFFFSTDEQKPENYDGMPLPRSVEGMVAAGRKATLRGSRGRSSILVVIEMLFSSTSLGVSNTSPPMSKLKSDPKAQRLLENKVGIHVQK